MIEKKHIVFSPNYKLDQWGNYFTTISRYSNENLIDSIVSFWQYRRNYYSDKVFAVPIPPTKDGKGAIMTNIVSTSDKVAYYDTLIEKSPLDENQKIARINIVRGQYTNAKFVDAILMDKSNDNGPFFEIMYIRGLPAQNIPPHPYEIVKHHKMFECLFNYSQQDILQSIEYWAHHNFINKVG